MFQELVEKGIAEQIKAVAIDMNAGFASVAKQYLPNARIVYDLFHVMQHYGQDVLKPARQLCIRQLAQRKELRDYKADRRLLRNVEWALLTPAEALKPDAKQRLEAIAKDNELILSLLPLGDMVRSVWSAISQQEACELLQECVELLETIAQKHNFSSALQFATLLKNHQEGILSAHQFRFGTNVLEGVNNRIKLIKRLGYGFRDFEYFKLKLMGCIQGVFQEFQEKIHEWTYVTDKQREDVSFCGAGL